MCHSSACVLPEKSESMTVQGSSPYLKAGLFVAMFLQMSLLKIDEATNENTTFAIGPLYSLAFSFYMGKIKAQDGGAWWAAVYGVAQSWT